jgi:hypothetical protein
MPTNRLYLAVLPIIHLSALRTPIRIVGTSVTSLQVTEQVLTVFPDRNFATEFYPDEVELYIDSFKQSAAEFLTSGHVTRYEFIRQPTDDGRVVVVVEQYVS